MTDLGITHLRKTYDGAVALDDVSIDLAEGEFVALLGPSGCGKTTTLRSVAGFVAPDRGDITLGGVSVTGLPPHRRNIGVVFQSYALFAHMTVAGNVGFGLKMRDVDRAEGTRRTAAALDMVGLSRFAERYPAELSGGQQQRVALARALVIEPRVLLLDEPLSNLDAQLRGEMRDEITALTRRLGMTTLFVTHDQSEALAMSDRVAVMRDGRIVEAAAPEALTERPQAAFTAEFLGGRTVLAGRIETDPNGPVFRVPGGPALPVKSPDAGPTHVVLRAGRLGLDGPGTNGPRAMPVAVERCVFLGDTRQITVRAGTALIQVHLPAEFAAPAPGAAMTLTIPDSALHFIHQTPERAA